MFISPTYTPFYMSQGMAVRNRLAVANEEDDKVADLYDRQSKLDLSIPEKVMIVGVGGVGSWTAISMALIGVPHIYLVDTDIIEEHNLNRTLFRESDIGTKKIEAVMELILERRGDKIEEVRIFDSLVEDLSDMELNEMSDCVIMDCRDILEPLPKELADNLTIKLGYDGTGVTFILNPDYSKMWEVDETRGYEVIPSYLNPCQFLACSGTSMVVDKDFNLAEHDNEIVTFDFHQHIAGIMGSENEGETEESEGE